MVSELAKMPSLIKNFVLLCLFTLITGFLLQVELPTAQGISEYVQNKMIERQFQLSNDEEDLLKQGWMYFNLGQYENAEQVMTKVLEKGYNVSAEYCMGLLDMRYGRYEKAVQRLEAVADRSPNHSATRICLGKAYYELRYYGKARTVLEEVVKFAPADEEARLWLAKTYLKTGNTDRAVQQLMSITHGREALEASALMKKIR